MKSSFLFFVFLLFIFLASDLTAQQKVLALNEGNTTIANFSATPLAYEPATFRGGNAELLRQVTKRLAYPTLAQEYGVEGTVVVRLQLDRKGKISESEVIKGLGFGCDEAALTALRQLPRWQAARKAGRRTEATVYVPLRFRLQ